MAEEKLWRSFPTSLSWSSRCFLEEVGGLKNTIIHYNNKLQQEFLQTPGLMNLLRDLYYELIIL